MKAAVLIILRIIVLAIALTVLVALSAPLSSPPDFMRRLTPEQTAQGALALPISSLIVVVVLSYLVSRSRWHGWRLAGALAALYYGLYTFLGQIELLVFPAVASQLPEGMVKGQLLGGLIAAVPISLLTVWLLGKARVDPAVSAEKAGATPVSEWAWKFAAGAILYVIVYFTFGYWVAWRTPGLPEFYGGTDAGFLAQVARQLRDVPWLFVLQFFRGLIWTSLGYLVVRMHRGRAWEVIVATGLTFTVLMNVSLLFPNFLMPPFVARAHAIELVSSDLIYGMLQAALLLWKPVRTKQPAADAGPGYAH